MTLLVIHYTSSHNFQLALPSPSYCLHTSTNAAYYTRQSCHYRSDRCYCLQVFSSTPAAPCPILHPACTLNGDKDTDRSDWARFSYLAVMQMQWNQLHSAVNHFRTHTLNLALLRGAEAIELALHTPHKHCWPVALCSPPARYDFTPLDAAWLLPQEKKNRFLRVCVKHCVGILLFHEAAVLCW